LVIRIRRRPSYCRRKR